MMRTNLARGLSCHAYMWSIQGPITQTDEQTAFRYEVRKFGELIGFITADRSRHHPEVKWDCSRLGENRSFAFECPTVDAAFEAF
jgi:hypothetical protein